MKTEVETVETEEEGSGGYDPELDVIREDFGWLAGDKIHVTVQSYDDGPRKLTLTRAGRKGKKRPAKRLTMAEAASLADVLWTNRTTLAKLAAVEDDE
jgi:hypothetical protein